MNKIRIYLILFIASFLIFAGIRYLMPWNRIPKEIIQVDKWPEIFPDYRDISIPVNIAPLNFNLKEKASDCIVVFSTENKNRMVSRSKRLKISFPAKKWRAFLTACVNEDITVEIYSKNEEKKWVKYKPYSVHVDADRIDKYIAFRQINAAYILWEKMGIYQRNLENFEQSPILVNDNTGRNCMNCHTFCNNNPEKMLIHLRQPPSGTLLYNKGEVRFINTKTNYTMSPCVYPSWHPNGNLIAFSVNLIKQKFPATGKRRIYVYDIASDIVVYNIEKNQITTCPELSTGNLENLPAWAHSGKYLYYISTPKYNIKVPDTTVKYSLVRIAYDTGRSIPY
jgi:hypothetical protein